MPRIQLQAQFGKATATFTCETSEPPAVSRPKNFGFGEGVCTCARCMRKAGPIREDVEERIVQISYVLAGVYVETPNPEEMVRDHHRKKAQEFMSLVEEGDVQQLREAFDSLSGGQDMIQEIATELIISAAQLGQADIIKCLADKGGELEERDLRRGGRPLMHAANNGHTAAVKALIDCGAETEARDDNGYTALMVAIFSDRSSAAEALLQAGAQVDAMDEKGRTALCYAAMYGSTDCIYLLANYGANVFHLDKDGNTPLELAEDSGRTSAVEALRKLQMKVKMQERRRHRQKAQGCQHLNEVELARLAAQAEAHAQLLLQQEEEEKARKARKAQKKHKKKGKGKAYATTGNHTGGEGAAHDCTDTHSHDSGCCGRLDHNGWTDTFSGSMDTCTGSSCRSMDLHTTVGDGACWKEGMVKSYDVDTQYTPPPPPPPPVVDVDELRRKWEALLAEASSCLDELRQPKLLTRVEAMLELCLEHGVSVKYGRKVLQRLQAVGPAREALRDALAMKPVDRTTLDEALKGVKGVQSLLDPDMVKEAENVLTKLRKQQEEELWNNLGKDLTWEPRMAAVPCGGARHCHEAGFGDDTIDADQECVVCLSAVKNCCCIPCGHVCMCEDCAIDVQGQSGLCPVCRTNIECVIEIL